MIFSQETFNLEKFKKKQQTRKYLRAKKRLLESIENRQYGFVEDLINKDFKKIFSVVKKLKEFENILFLGTGGSSLGGKTLVSIVRNQFYNSKKPNIFFIENVDAKPINNLLKEINLNKTACVVTSKSGETIETISQYFLIENLFKEKEISLKDKIFVITEEKESTLKKIQENKKLIFLPHPQFVGGRFSVFSIVGLIPAALVNIDINKFCEGAKEFLIMLKEDKNFDDYFLPILGLIELNKIGVNMSVIMPYSDLLNNLSFWYRQLWAESNGKDNKGITPINSLGTVDQHSQLQLYLDGPRDKFFTLIGIQNKGQEKMLDCMISENEIYNALHKKSMQKLLDSEMKATVEVLKKRNLPLRILMIDSIEPKLIGSLMMFFFMETIFGCLLLNTNPFDQPAVEDGKKLIKEFLQKNE